MKFTPPELIKANTESGNNTPGYVLYNEGRMVLASMVPQVRGECFCILMLTYDGQKYKQSKKSRDMFINLGSADLARMAKKIEWIAKKHPRNKPIHLVETVS